METFWIIVLILFTIIFLLAALLLARKRINLNKKLELIFDELREEVTIEHDNNYIWFEANNEKHHLVFIPVKSYYQISFNSPKVIEITTRHRRKKISLEQFQQLNSNLIIILISHNGPYTRWINESEIEEVNNGDRFWNLTITNEEAISKVLGQLNK